MKSRNIAVIIFLNLFHFHILLGLGNLLQHSKAINEDRYVFFHFCLCCHWYCVCLPVFSLVACSSWLGAIFYHKIFFPGLLGTIHCFNYFVSLFILVTLVSLNHSHLMHLKLTYNSQSLTISIISL